MDSKGGNHRTYKPPRFYREKISMGVACCRFNGTRPEILLVCKRYTYSYVKFVHGHYNSNNNAVLIALFNGMTIDEKHDLLSLNFAQIWYRIWLDNICRNTSYFVAKNKFESTFVIDGGARLRKLISSSTHSDKVWEIPKGHKKNKIEPDIHCAIREFYEETNVPKKKYKLLPASKTYSYIDDDVKYTYTYYIAIAEHMFEPRIDFSREDQINEISDIRWMDIDDIRWLRDSRLENFIKPIFNYVKKHTASRILVPSGH